MEILTTVREKYSKNLVQRRLITRTDDEDIKLVDSERLQKGQMFENLYIWSLNFRTCKFRDFVKIAKIVKLKCRRNEV